MSDFDFEANPHVPPAVIHTLATCEWVKHGQPLCLIGDSGNGKSHLLIALGTEAAMAGYRVKYGLETGTDSYRLARTRAQQTANTA